jgi:hypothetical protein
MCNWRICREDDGFLLNLEQGMTEINMVTIKSGARAGQFGELSELSAPEGKAYIRLACQFACRNKTMSKTAMQSGNYGAVTLQSWDDIEVAV